MCTRRFSINYYIKQIKHEVFYFYLFSGIAISVPFLAFFISCIWLPQDETLGTWIQRSGSCVAVFGLLAEARAVNCYFILNPGVPVEIGYSAAKEQYGKHPKRLNLFSFIIIAAGTFIWGYGDIPFK